jgi:hypothetical protein
MMNGITMQKREAKNKYPVKWWAQYVRDLEDLSDAVESGGTERPHGRKKTYFANVPHADPASCRGFALGSMVDAQVNEQL